MKGKSAVKITEDYYNSKDANTFYQKIWSTDYLHVGSYKEDTVSIEEASVAMIERMLRLLPKMKKSSKLLDLGSGYGGTARYLVETYGCNITCVNISEVQNEINSEKNKKAELDNKISVVKANFEKLPFTRDSFDLVWSQDAFLHSAHKDEVFREVSRVINNEGRFIFTDFIKKEKCPADVLEPILQRLQLKDLATIKRYDRLAQNVDLAKVYTKEMPEMMLIHYRKVLERLEADYKNITKKVTKSYIDNMMKGLQLWIDGAEAGHISWALFQYQKKNVWI
jgi:sarcosine/dimethylglycine N-methyltransferase